MSPIKADESNRERESEREGRYGERGREVERPWRTAAEREAEPGTIETDDASEHTKRTTQRKNRNAGGGGTRRAAENM